MWINRKSKLRIPSEASLAEKSPHPLLKSLYLIMQPRRSAPLTWIESQLMKSRKRWKGFLESWKLKPLSCLIFWRHFLLVPVQETEHEFTIIPVTIGGTVRALLHRSSPFSADWLLLWRFRHNYKLGTEVRTKGHSFSFFFFLFL